MVGGATSHASVQLKNLNDDLMYIKLCDQLGRILNHSALRIRGKKSWLRHRRQHLLR